MGISRSWIGKTRLYCFLFALALVVMAFGLAKSSSDCPAYADSGSGWQVQATYPNAFFRALDAVDEDTAWVGGDSGLVVRTIDGGTNWMECSSTNPYNPDNPFPVAEIEAVGADTAWVVSKLNLSTGTLYQRRSYLLKTVDAGQNWTIQHDLDGMLICDICAVDASTAWASLAIYDSPSSATFTSYILRTDDGGTGWAPQYQLPEDVWISQISAVDAATAWAVGDDGTILKTSDGGVTWTPQQSGTSIPLRGISAVDSMTAWALGGNSIHKTIDGGETWTIREIEAANAIVAISAISDSVCWVAGDGDLSGWYYGTILKTVDGGENWATQLKSPYLGQIQGLAAVDTLTAWAVSPFSYGIDCPILATKDGGGAMPEIVSLSPSSGPVGTQVTISGYNFGEAQDPSYSYVIFGTVQATDFVSWSDTEIKVNVPAGVEGELVVMVITFRGVSDKGLFTVTQGPSVTSISPNQGMQNTIALDITDLAGSGFAPGAQVRLEKGTTVINAYNIVVSDTKITCTIGLFLAEPGAYDVVVTNPDGGEARLEGAFTVTSACGGGSGAALIMLGAALGLLSLAGGIRSRGGSASNT